jgi:alanine racemase
LRSELRIDAGAIRDNARALVRALGGAELWAVVKANGYGHGALDAARAALAGGARAVCVATVAEALALRAELSDVRLVVMGPTPDAELAAARDGRLELVAADGRIPEGVPVHLKLDTGMGRWGVREVARPPRNVVGLMSHFATADADRAFAETQLERFLAATAGLEGPTRHIANSAAALRLPGSRLDAARCGIALYGLSPFGGDPAEDGLRPALAWRSEVASVKRLERGDSAGYGRRFTAERPTWIGVVPVGYADGFRRDLTGTEVLVDGERRRVVGTVSMDAFTVELPGPVAPGAPVTIIGDGLLAEEHARVAGTITYELTSRIESGPSRARRVVVDA